MADELLRAATELDAIVPEFWSAKFYPTLLEALPFADSVARDYEGEIQALGDTVNISSFPQFDLAVDLAEDEKADADSITVTGTKLVINHQIVKDFIITRKAVAQSIDASNKLRDLALHSILKKIQKLIITDVVPNAAAPDHSIAYATGTTLALADILAAKELLDEQDVPDDGMRAFIVGSAQWNDLFNITGFTSRDYVASANALSSGTISTPVLGFRPKWTTEAAAVAYFFHPLFLQLAVQEGPEVEVFNLGGEGKRARRVNMTVLFGDKQVDGLRVATVA